jgi:hypothetical protein
MFINGSFKKTLSGVMPLKEQRIDYGVFVSVGDSVGSGRVGVKVGMSGTGVFVGGIGVDGSLVGGATVGGMGVTLGVRVGVGVGVGRFRPRETRFSA